MKILIFLYSLSLPNLYLFIREMTNRDLSIFILHTNLMSNTKCPIPAVDMTETRFFEKGVVKIIFRFEIQK